VFRRIVNAASLVLAHGPRPVLFAREAKRRGAIQKKGELRSLLSLLLRRKPQVVVEIGTYRGGTLWLWCRVAAANARVISIDLPGGAFGGGYDDSDVALFHSFTKRRQKLVLIQKDSHDPATREQVVTVLRGRPVDFLFIDGDHTYDGVKQDFEMYAPLVASGGLIALHDIVPNTPDTSGDVPVFWNELKHRGGYEMRELIDVIGHPGFGIGVVFVE
jgi:cephalosporin hydroxylase